jgi:hypothetical protein
MRFQIDGGGPDLFRHACLMGLEVGKVKNRKHHAFSRVLDQF